MLADDLRAELDEAPYVERADRFRKRCKICQNTELDDFVRAANDQAYPYKSIASVANRKFGVAILWQSVRAHTQDHIRAEA